MSFFLAGWAGTFLTCLFFSDQAQKVKAVIQDQEHELTIERLQEATKLEVKEPGDVFTKMLEIFTRKVPVEELQEYAYWGLLPGFCCAFNATILGRDFATSSRSAFRFTGARSLLMSILSFYVSTASVATAVWMEKEGRKGTYEDINYRDLFWKVGQTTLLVSPFLPMAILPSFFMTRNLILAPPTNTLVNKIVTAAQQQQQHKASAIAAAIMGLLWGSQSQKKEAENEETIEGEAEEEETKQQRE